MGTPAGPGREVGRQSFERPTFLRDLEGCVSDWGQTLSGSALVRDQALTGLLQRTVGIQQRAAGVGFGGIGHHLGVLLGGAAEGHGVSQLRAQLEVVKAMQSQARDTLSIEEAAYFARHGGRASEAQLSGSRPIAPPRMITHVTDHSSSEAPPPPPVVAAVPPSPVPPAPLTPPVFGAPSPPKMLFESQMAARAQAAQPGPGPMAGGPAPPPALHAPLPAPRSPLPMGPLPSPEEGGAAARQAAPNLFVRSLLGLRAPGRRREVAPVAPPAPLPPGPSTPPPLLGLKAASSSSSGSSSSSSAPGLRAPKPPQHLTGYAGLPSLPREAEQRPSHRPSSPPRVRASSPPARGRGRPDMLRGEGESRWWVGVLAVGGVGLIVGLIVTLAVVLSRRSGREETASISAPSPTGSAGAPPPSAQAGDPALPRSRLLNDNERLRSLLAQVHGRGKETAELRALVDEQAAIAAQALAQQRCQGSQCAVLREVQKLVSGTAERQKVRRRSRPPDALRPRWLAGLDMPEIPVEDDPLVRKRFEFYTENAVGRETFQQMLFRCGAFKDSIQASLIRRGLPAALLAVVFAESGCAPTAKSPAGAEGLWQFIPEAARAYHLRIIPEIVDERHSPQKSTEAAVRYLSDMHAKLGSWDLVFAAYNMGPFGLMTRLQRVEGDDVGFWDLVDAGFLPDETANYAPSIQAIALILNNLQRLKFIGQMRAPEVTMELDVPPATRLSLVARAAAMSVNELRRLNLDLKAGMTPNVPNFVVHVPKDSVWQARETLGELLKSKDESDQCVAPNFDWGRQRFTPDMAKACAANLARAVETAPAPGAPPAP